MSLDYVSRIDFPPKKLKTQITSKFFPPVCKVDKSSFKIESTQLANQTNIDERQRLEVETHVHTKLMRFGVPNPIVDNSDFKPANFDRQFWSDKDFNN